MANLTFATMLHVNTLAALGLATAIGETLTAVTFAPPAADSPKSAMLVANDLDEFELPDRAEGAEKAHEHRSGLFCRRGEDTPADQTRRKKSGFAS